MIQKILKNKYTPFVTLIIFGLSFSYFITKEIPINVASSIEFIEPVYAADFSSNKILMGASHNVFAGKVIEQIGTKERGIGPETQFSVEVIENLKGELKGTVTLNQQGGYKDGVLYIVASENEFSSPSEKDDTYLLHPGSTYVFATRYNSKENWYTLNSYPTALGIISYETKSLNELRSMAQNNPRVKELQEAYKNEVLLDADVKNDNTLNNYKSFQEKLNEKRNNQMIEVPMTKEIDVESETAPENTVERTIPDDSMYNVDAKNEEDSSPASAQQEAQL